MANRRSAFAGRAKVQRERFKLPAFPTTTIGSFPQTSEVRKVRAAFTKGTIGQAEYDQFLREETKRTVAWQEEIGLDVLVHGEFERNDMVQYFGSSSASPSPSTPGCRAMDRAASVRRSCSAMSPGRSR
jgi:5-methyltetrahydropteroyltriglutamate--homocysteine methyltransferase